MNSLASLMNKYDGEARPPRNDCVRDQFSPELQWMGPEQRIEVMAKRWAEGKEIWKGERSLTSYERNQV